MAYLRNQKKTEVIPQDGRTHPTVVQSTHTELYMPEINKTVVNDTMIIREYLLPHEQPLHSYEPEEFDEEIILSMEDIFGPPSECDDADLERHMEELRLEEEFIREKYMGGVR